MNFEEEMNLIGKTIVGLKETNWQAMQLQWTFQDENSSKMTLLKKQTDGVVTRVTIPLGVTRQIFLAFKSIRTKSSNPEKGLAIGINYTLNADMTFKINLKYPETT